MSDLSRASVRLLLAGILLFGGLAVGRPARAALAPLVVRVGDVAGSPGDVVAVVLRTTSARPIRQGRISIRPRKRARSGRLLRGASPFLDLVDYSVLSGAGDSLTVGILQDDASGQRATLQFTSSSGTVNRTDGTLAVLYLRLRRGLQPGERFVLELEDVELIDNSGNVIALNPVAGLLKVQGAQRNGQLVIASDDVEVEGGEEEDARFGVQSLEAQPLGSGVIVLTYDATIAAGTPRVWLNKKQGTRRSSVDTSIPGRISIDFESRDGSFNSIPGEILSVKLPTRAGIAPGRSVALRFDSAATVLRDPDGNIVPYRLRDGVLRFVADHDDGGDDGDDDDDDGGGGEEGEFESTALTADVATSLIGLADGTIVLVMPQVEWDDDGDFTDLGSLAAALQGGATVRVRGKGDVNADGAIVAKEIRADLED